MTLIEISVVDQFIHDNWLYFAITQDDGFSFKRWSNDETEEISRHDYCLAKYGFYTDDDIFSERVRIDNGHVVVSNYKMASLKILDINGILVKDLSSLYSELDIESIYSLEIGPSGFLWLVGPTNHYVGKIDLDNMKEEFSWRQEQHSDRSEFNYPQHVSYSNGHIYVSDMGNKRIAVVDPYISHVSTWKTVGKPVFYIDFLPCGSSVFKFDDGLFIDSPIVNQLSVVLDK